MDRRDFLKACGILLAHAALPDRLSAETPSPMRTLTLLPIEVRHGKITWGAPHLELFPKELSAIYHLDVRLAPPEWITVERPTNEDDVMKYLNRGQTRMLGVISAPLYDSIKSENDMRISGVGSMPGNRSVVTTYWRARNTTPSIAHRRTLDVMLHELGHNFGADDCDVYACTMHNDPSGKRRRLDPPSLGYFCDDHKAALRDWLR